MLRPLESVLCVFAHPDDEVLGCGGYLSYLAQHEIPVTFLWLAYRHDEVAKENAEALELLGFANCGMYRVTYPDNRLDTVPQAELNAQVERAVAEQKPSLVLTHDPGDLNVDHRKTFEAAVVATRPLTSQLAIDVVCCEVLSSSNYCIPFAPTIYHPLHRQDFVRKVAAMAAYKSQSREAPHPRSPDAIEARAVSHGSMCGSMYAEAFRLFRGSMP